MTTLVDFEVRENIAVITLNHPPVNSLGIDLRTGILEGFNKAISDDSVEAMVIASSGKLFCGGADISEFGSGKATSFPDLQDLCDLLEKSTKPIIAAINGMALGGGCELTLVCEYRIALPQAKLGLPEVHLGILPGAGGRQRLPRLAGPVVALDMITSGAPVGVEKMQDAGVIDRIHSGEGDFLTAAVDYAKELVESNAPLRDCADITINKNDLPEGFFDDYRKRIARRTRGFYAPERCIQAVEAACDLPLAEGLKKEAELFLECGNTSQARAQQHLFFAERAATKIPDIDPKTPIRKVKKVAVIGSGLMGGGIAMNFINAGIETTILDLNAEALERGVAAIRKNYEISASKGRLTNDQVEGLLSLLKSTTDYADVGDADLVIEAVFEKMDIKKSVFKTLDDVCKPGAILATNTSTLNVDEIAASISRPQDVIGLHFFSPANVMRLLEVVRGGKSADDVVMTTIKMAQKIKKVPVVSGVCWGFIGNRIIEPYGRGANRLLLEGASPAQIDKVIYDFGLAMGPLTMGDLAGIDISCLVHQGEGHGQDWYSRDPGYYAINEKLYSLGRYGQKTGRGIYIYEGRDKKDDPEILVLAAELAKEQGITQREISDQEILERTIYMLINEGAEVLNDGVAYRSSDIDMVYCNGYGFPDHRGGPMQYADEIGLDTVLEAINKYRQSLGDYGEAWFKPSPLLEKLVAEGKKFRDVSQ